MDCREAEEQLVPYLLGALDAKETAMMEQHIETCASCRSKLHEEGETVAELAYAVPQFDAPPQVRQRLMAKIEAELSPGPTGWLRAGWRFALPDLGMWLASRSGPAVVSALALVVVIGGIWFDARLDRLAEEKDVISARVDTMADVDLEMTEKVRNVIDLSYMAAVPDTSVNMLSATGAESRTARQARGMIMAPKFAPWAILATYDLPPLPENGVYQVWLVKDGVRHDAGFFTPDSTGYGLKKFPLFVPIDEVDAIVITQERGGGSPDPTGESVLAGDL